LQGRRNNLIASGRLHSLGQSLEGRSGAVTLGEIADALGPTAIGVVLVVLTLPALIPIPGPIGFVFGSVLILVSAQLLASVRRLWLPEMVRRRQIPVGVVVSMVTAGLPLVRRAETLLKPRRLLPLTGRLGRTVLAAPLMVLALTIALPIPLGNLLPAFGIIVISLGLVMRDGLAVLVGLIIGVLATVWTIAVVAFGSLMAEPIWALLGQ
jgi:hypothetical protein